MKLTEEHAPYNTELNGKTGVFIETLHIEESTKLIQQILDDHEKINRFNHLFSLHKKIGVPTNKPELTGVNQNVIDQIQNVITHILEYIEYGKIPNNYSHIKKLN